MMHEDRQCKLAGLRIASIKQPITYKPLFDEAMGHAADLLHEICYIETYLTNPTLEMMAAGQLKMSDSDATAAEVFRAMIEVMPKGP